MLFARSPLTGFRLTLFVVLSLALMGFDHLQGDVHRELRAKLSALVFPIQYLVDKPVRLVDWVATSFATHQHLLEENTRLQARWLLLQAELQKFMELEKENQQLRALLRSSPRVSGHVLVSQLLAVSTEPFVEQVVLDKGKKDELYVGQAVLDANGVMGQVVEVGPLTSRVLLVTDPSSAVPVQIQRNGIRGVVEGSGDGSLRMRHVPVTLDVKVGDKLITSGLAQRYPMGYPVGEVVSVTSSPGERFAAIRVQPSAHVDRSRQVLLVWPEDTAAVNTSKAAMAMAMTKART